MRPVDRQDLSEHEVKRCRAVARGNPWEVWEEQIIWWGADPNHMQPVQDDLLPQHRRWLFVDTESGVIPALCWEIGDDFELPSSAGRPAGSQAAVRPDGYYA